MKSRILVFVVCFIAMVLKNESLAQTGTLGSGITANAKNNAMAALIASMGVSLKLRAISSSDVNIEGTSTSWIYKYGMTDQPHSSYYFTATYDTVKLDSTGPTHDGEAFILHPWINSSEALKITDDSTGARFRDAYPDYAIYADVHEVVVPYLPTFWYIKYTSKIKACSLEVSMDATTGRIIGIYTTGIPTDVESDAHHVPQSPHLGQNYPNPFNPSTTISFSVLSQSFVTLNIFDVMGREISTVAAEEMTAGKYTRQWNASGFPSGVYFYRLQAGEYTETKRLLLLR